MSEKFYPLYNLKDKSNVLVHINNIINYYSAELVDKQFDLFKKSLQLSFSYGSDLDIIGSLYGLVRYDTESDLHFRTRIVANYTYRTPMTKEAIKRYFNAIYGYRPIIHEDFETRFYNSSNPPSTDVKAAWMLVMMPLNVLKVQEVNFINDDGSTVTPYHFNINTTTPITEVYYYEDHAHNNDYAEPGPDPPKLDNDGNINLIGSHEAGKKVMTYYDIIPDELFDTLLKTTSAYGIYQEDIDRVKAGGIEVDLAYYWDLLHDWFHGDIDDLVVTESFDRFTIMPLDELILTTDEGYSINIYEFPISDNPFSGSRTDSTTAIASTWGHGLWSKSLWGGTATFFANSEL